MIYGIPLLDIHLILAVACIFTVVIGTLWLQHKKEQKKNKQRTYEDFYNDY